MNHDHYFVDPDCATAEGLPPHAFTDTSFATLEQEALFAKAWQFVPRRTAADLADDARPLDAILSRRGARVPLALGGTPVYLQRDWDGGLHCFPNVCTHAWHALVEGIGRERFAVCPQHGREFDCHGKMTKHPGFQGVPDFPRRSDHLRNLPVWEWGPWLWACLSERTGAPIDDVLHPVRESLAPNALDALQRRPQEGEVRVVPGNWKHHAWNYMDKFHIAFLHRAPGGLADAIDLSRYATELYEGASLQWVPAKDPAHGIAPERLGARFGGADAVFALWWLVFPNVTLNFYRWGCSVNVYEPVPSDPTTTRFHWYHWVWDEAAYAQRESVYLNSQVDAEDVDAMSQVLRGTRSGFADRPRFAPSEESGPHWFHRSIYRACFEPHSPLA